MILVFILYMFFASTFTFGKAALLYIKPFLLVGIRMIVGGILLLGYQKIRRIPWQLHWDDWKLLARIIVFHIYVPFMCEFWSLTQVISSKACLIFNLSPFVTALLSIWYMQPYMLSYVQWYGLIIGFFGLLPLVYAQTPLEFTLFSFISLQEVSLFIAVISSAYAWLVFKDLTTKQYSPVTINGFGMLFGGIAALLTSFIIEGVPQIHYPIVSHDILLPYVQSIVPFVYIPIVLASIYIGLLILISNIICYNLYGFLLNKYSPTLISFAGFTTPLFAVLFGLIVLGEVITWHFFVALSASTLGLYLFYRDEL